MAYRPEASDSPIMRAVREFEDRNGEDGIEIGEYVVFSNGAFRDADMISLGTGKLVDPPADLFRRARIRQMYQKELLRRAVQKFDAVKQEATLASEWSKHNGNPPPTYLVDQLKKLQVLVQERKEAVQKADAEVEKYKPPGLLTAEAQRMQFLESVQKFANDVAGISV